MKAKLKYELNDTEETIGLKNEYNALIINFVTNPPTSEYTEVHHIIPKCMGGTNDEDNLICLPYEYHVRAHILLAFIYPNHSGVIIAADLMTKLNSSTIEEKDKAIVKFFSNLDQKTKEDIEKINIYYKNIIVSNLKTCEDIVKRGAWDEASYKINKNLYNWIHVNRDKYEVAKIIWKHISIRTQISTNDYISTCEDIVKRRAWNEVNKKDNEKLYDWICKNRDKYEVARIIWKHISIRTRTNNVNGYISTCEDIVKRGAWSEASRSVNKNLYYWVHVNRDKYEVAKIIWKHISFNIISANDYIDICKDIIKRGAWDEASYKINKNLYNWIHVNRDKYEVAKIIWNILTK